MDRPRLLRATLIGAVGVLSLAPVADAALMLKVVSSAGGPTFTVTDNDTSDFVDEDDGKILTYVKLPGYNISLFTVFSNSPGTASRASISITSHVERKAFAGDVPVLTVTATDTDFALPQGSNFILTSGGGGSIDTPVIGDYVKFQSFANDDNQAYSVFGATSGGVQPSVPTTPSLGLVSYENVSLSVPFGAENDYSLTNIQTIRMGMFDAVADFAGSTTVTASVVPEPALLGIVGIFGLSLFRPRRR